MTHGSHKHDHQHDHPKNQEGPWWKHVHRSWLFWTGLVLMILAMGVYVLSVSESLWPGGGVKPPVQAAP